MFAAKKHWCPQIRLSGGEAYLHQMDGRLSKTLEKNINIYTTRTEICGYLCQHCRGCDFMPSLNESSVLCRSVDQLTADITNAPEVKCLEECCVGKLTDKLQKRTCVSYRHLAKTDNRHAFFFSASADVCIFGISCCIRRLFRAIKNE